MGLVFRGYDPRVSRPVAVKVLKPGFAARPGARARFLQEVRAAGRLEHPHTVPVYDVGEQRGVHFLVMPLLRGEPLDDRLARDGPLPAADVLRVACGAAAGLAAAHAAGVIHRDVKPSNLWLDGEPGGAGWRVRVLDFGLSQPTDTGDPLTPAGAVAGTVPYMSPEQALGRPLDERTDLFSLGVVLYEALAGVRVFHREHPAAAALAVVESHPEPPDRVRAGVPPELPARVMRLLSKNPADRPASAAAVVAEADRLSSPVPPGRPRGPPAPAPPDRGRLARRRADRARRVGRTGRSPRFGRAGRRRGRTHRRPADRLGERPGGRQGEDRLTGLADPPGPGRPTGP